MSFDKIVIELPGSGDTTYEAQGNIEFNPGQQPQYTVNAGNGITALTEQLINTDASPLANVYLNFGQGERAITIRFNGWRGESGQWGNLPQDARAARKAQKLDHEIANREIDSRKPITLTYGSYSDTAGDQFGPLKVVPSEVNLPFTTGEGESVNVFTGEITFKEAVVADQAIHKLNPF